MTGNQSLRQRIDPARHCFSVALRDHLLMQFRDKGDSEIERLGLDCVVNSLFKVAGRVQKLGCMTMQGVEARRILTKEFSAENLTQHRLTEIGQMLPFSAMRDKKPFLLKQREMFGCVWTVQQGGTESRGHVLENSRFF